MAELLHEFWRGDGEGEFGPVRESSDRLRQRISPDLRFVFELRASSWKEAMRLYEERAYGEFGKTYDHIDDIGYSDQELVEQEAYLRIREVNR